MQILEGKVALVTGGASGIGAAVVKEFAEQGARILLTDVNDAGAKLAAAYGDAAEFFKHDVRDESQWREAVAQAEKRFGPLHILVNNAGIIAPGNNEGPIEEIDAAEFRKVFEVNQLGTFLGIKHAVPSMKKAGSGSIVNISSVGGMVGTPYTAAYSATKWAVRGIAKVAAVELGRFGIRVNSVHPGAIWTPIHHAGQSEELANKTRAHIENVVKVLPLPRMAEPSEVAKMVAFISSDQASYSTGCEFVVDGGLSAM